MIDIGNALSIAMQKKQCSSLYALLLLSEEKENGMDILQSKSPEKVSRGLRDKSDFKTNGARLGTDIHGYMP